MDTKKPGAMRVGGLAGINEFGQLTLVPLGTLKPLNPVTPARR